MPYRGQRMLVTADQVMAVRLALQETQTDFAHRFSRSRYAIIRWETRGVKFSYQSNRWRRWQCAISLAINLAIERGSLDDQLEDLRKLQTLSTQQ